MATVNDTKPHPIELLPPARDYLAGLLTRLRDVEGTVVVAAHALEAEQAWVGTCTARVLRTQVSNILSVEIERALERFSLNLPTHEDLQA